MGLIEVEIKALRDVAQAYSGKGVDMVLKRAADTIEELSAKLASANMERSTAYYNEGWIPCSERLPKTNDAVNVTWINRNPAPYHKNIKDKPFTATGHYHDGKWYWYSCISQDLLDEYRDSYGDRMDEDIEVIAWQPLPEPYQPKGENHEQY